MQVYSVMSLVLHVLPLLQQNYWKLCTLIQVTQVPVGGSKVSNDDSPFNRTHDETSHKDPPPSTSSDLNSREINAKNYHCELCSTDYEKKIVYHIHLD